MTGIVVPGSKNVWRSRTRRHNVHSDVPDPVSNSRGRTCRVHGFGSAWWTESTEKDCQSGDVGVVFYPTGGSTNFESDSSLVVRVSRIYDPASDSPTCRSGSRDGVLLWDPTLFRVLL